MYIEKSAVSQLIITNKSVITQKRSYKNQLDYKRNLQRWITKYKSVDDNERIAHYFGDLSINIHNDHIPEPTTKSLYTKFKQFHTSIGQI